MSRAVRCLGRSGGRDARERGRARNAGSGGRCRERNTGGWGEMQGVHLQEGRGQSNQVGVRLLPNVTPQSEKNFHCFQNMKETA